MGDSRRTCHRSKNPRCSRRVSRVSRPWMRVLKSERFLLSDDGLFPRATTAALQNRSVVVRMAKAHASCALGSAFMRPRCEIGISSSLFARGVCCCCATSFGTTSAPNSAAAAAMPLGGFRDPLLDRTELGARDGAALCARDRAALCARTCDCARDCAGVLMLKC